MTKAQTAEREEFRAKLREIVKPGMTVHTTLRSVSRSGMNRKIGVHLFTCEDGEVRKRWLTYWVAKACGFTFDEKTECISIGGCGTDMGFEIVYNLGRALYPDGFGCVGEKCRSNDHSNGDRDRTPHGNGMAPHVREPIVGADHWHGDGGYALRHEWI